jgi:hypothetical protein
MNQSAPAKNQPASQSFFFEQAHAAMLRASRQVAAENKRLGLPLIVEVAKRRPLSRKAKA